MFCDHPQFSNDHSHHIAIAHIFVTLRNVLMFALHAKYHCMQILNYFSVIVHNSKPLY